MVCQPWARSCILPIMVQQLFLIRHDRVVFPDHHPNRGQPTSGIILGQLDYPITTMVDENRYAQLAAAITAQRMVVDDIFFTGSDLHRARATHERLQYYMGVPASPLMTNADFREQHFGAWQGQTYDQVAASDRATHDWFWQDFITRPPPRDAQGMHESFWQLYQRVVAAMARLLAVSPAPRVVLVAHDGVIRALLAFFYQQAEIGDNSHSVASGGETAAPLPNLSKKHTITSLAENFLSGSLAAGAADVPDVPDLPDASASRAFTHVMQCRLPHLALVKIYFAKGGKPVIELG